MHPPATPAQWPGSEEGPIGRRSGVPPHAPTSHPSSMAWFRGGPYREEIRGTTTCTHQPPQLNGLVQRRALQGGDQGYHHMHPPATPAQWPGSEEDPTGRRSGVPSHAPTSHPSSMAWFRGGPYREEIRGTTTCTHQPPQLNGLVQRRAPTRRRSGVPPHAPTSHPSSMAWFRGGPYRKEIRGTTTCTHQPPQLNGLVQRRALQGGDQGYHHMAWFSGVQSPDTSKFLGE